MNFKNLALNSPINQEAPEDVDLDTILSRLKPQDTQTATIPFAPQATMPDDMAALAQQEAAAQAISRAPAQEAPSATFTPPKLNGAPDLNASQSSMTKTKTSTSGTLPSGDKPKVLSPEERLEKLMADLKDERSRSVEDAHSRQLKANVIQSIVGNIGNVIGGNQAMNTGASVTPTKVQGIDIGDLVGKVDKRFAGDQEALLNQYKMLMDSKDKESQRKFQQDSLAVQREGLNIKKLLADKKAETSGFTPGEEAVDKAFAKDYNNLTSKGFNNAQTAIGRLDAIAAELEKNKDSLTAGGGRTSILPDSLRSTDSIRWRDAASNEANATLKELFPGSLSDDERRAAAREFYNDKLSNAENAKIIKAKSAQLKQSFLDQQAKAERFRAKGTLKERGESQRSPAIGNDIDNKTPSSAQNTITNVGATVERLDKASGKVAIFDAKTKAFIKYKD